jgi:glycosyltransferase involved in cell wall biosynthesis
MKFAYLILAHKNPTQLLRIVKALDADYVRFFVHIDAKCDEQPFREVLSCRDNVYFTSHRFNVNWGGFSMLEATFRLISDMLKFSELPDYVHLISGMDFPIKSKQDILDFFKLHNGKNFIETFSLPTPRWQYFGMNRVLYNWKIDTLGLTAAYDDVAKQQPQNALPDFKLYGGSQWWSLTGNCIEMLLNMYNSKNEIINFFRSTFCPDEMLFQTAICNSQFKQTVADENMRKIDWGKGTPKIWRNEDYYKFISCKELFARKFDAEIDSKIIDRLEAGKQVFINTYELPLISVVMAAYNVEEYLPESIESTLTQSYSNFELIIADDGSSDNSLKVMQSYKDRRIKIIKCVHDFVPSLNAAMNAAQGKYIARMDSDDVMMPQRLEIQLEYMETHPAIAASGGFAHYFGLNQGAITVATEHIEIATIMLHDNTIVNPSSIIRKDFLKTNDLHYKSRYAYSEDFKMWTDIITCGGKLSNIPCFLVNYRSREGQLTRAGWQQMNRAGTYVKEEYQQYVSELLSSIDEDTRRYIETLRNQAKPEEAIQIIKQMYKNYLEYIQI